MFKKKVAPLAPEEEHEEAPPPITLAVENTAGDPSQLFKDILLNLCKEEGSDGLAKNWEEARLQYSLAVSQGAETLSTELEEKNRAIEKARIKAEKKKEKEHRAASPTRRSPSPQRPFPGEHSSSSSPATARRLLPQSAAPRSDELGCHEAGPYFRKGAMFYRDPMFQFYFGECFLLGDGLSTNDKMARSWFEKAAAQGYPPAECKLGTMMVQGRGGPRDIPAGYQLWEKASAAKESNAASNLLALAAAVTTTELF